MILAGSCHANDEKSSPGTDRGITIALVGLVNSGKSALFNMLSKHYSDVANYPQTTIAIFRKKSVVCGEPVDLIDTPGIGSLNVLADDEKLTRDLLLSNPPSLILFCADATRLKRSLILYSQVAELGIPVVFCLGKADDAASRGLVVEAPALEREIRAHVVVTVAEHGIGLKELEKAMENAGYAQMKLSFPREIEHAAEKVILAAGNIKPNRAIVNMFLAGDKYAEQELLNLLGEPRMEQVLDVRHKLELSLRSGNAAKAFFDTREKWADSVAETVLHSSSASLPSLATRVASISRHAVWGWPILLAVLYVLFYGVVHGSGMIAGMLEGYIFGHITAAIDSAAGDGILREFLTGHYGIWTAGLMNAIVTVVPILLVFFLIVNLLEDVGYLPNVSVLTNRLFSIFGLTGKAVLPITLGLGCNTMATLTTRSLETKKQRIIAIFLIALGVPCAVQFGIMLAIMASAGFATTMIVGGTVIATQIVFGVALGRMIKSAEPPDFILELPPLRLPHWKNVARKTYLRIKWFLYEAAPLFVAAAFMMFVFEKTGILELLKRFFRPVVTGLLGLPETMAEVFILVLARREVGAAYFKTEMFDTGVTDFTQTIVGLTVMTLFIPCASNTLVMIKELGYRWALPMNAAIILTAIAVGTLQNALIRAFI